MTTERDVSRWIDCLMELAGVPTVKLDDDTLGLMGVGDQFARVVEAFSCALVNVARGEPLPTLIRRLETEKKDRASRRRVRLRRYR